MSHAGPSLEEIKRASQARVHDVLAALGIAYRPRGNYISMCNPVEKDRHPSFTIWVKGPAAGAFKDHRGLAQGDIIDLVAYIKGWSAGPRKGRREALRFLADLTGLARMTDEQRRADLARSRARAQVEDKKRAEALADKQKRAFKIWLAGHACAGGTYVEHYLRRRGIELEATPRILRYLANHPHNESGRTWPCMAAGCVDTRGRILAIHRTWIDPVTFDKAPIEPNRKVWPDFRGLVIPLWRGESGLSVHDAARHGLRETLVLCEGIETALSAALAAPAFRTWAFISLGNLQNVTLPECVDSVALHRENEWDNAAAIKSFERGKAALERQGRPVAEITVPAGYKDLNDVLMGAA